MWSWAKLRPSDNPWQGRQWPPWWLLLSARVWGHSVACEGSWWIWSFVVSSLCSPFPVPAQKPPLLRVLLLPASGRTPTTSLCQVELLIYIYLTIWKIFFSPYKVQPATVNFWVCLVTFSKSSEKWEVGAGGGRCFPCEIPLFWPPEFPEIFIYLHVQKSQLFILFFIGCACKWRCLQLKWDFSHIQKKKKINNKPTLYPALTVGKSHQLLEKRQKTSFFQISWNCTKQRTLAGAERRNFLTHKIHQYRIHATE